MEEELRLIGQKLQGTVVNGVKFLGKAKVPNGLMCQGHTVLLNQPLIINQNYSNSIIHRYELGKKIEDIYSSIP